MIYLNLVVPDSVQFREEGVENALDLSGRVAARVVLDSNGDGRLHDSS
jgi:hypothetical protein